MSAPREPIFVQRRTYRRRRLADGARLLPLLGAVLFMVPLLWHAGGETPAGGVETLRDGNRTAWVMTYLFLVWLGLAILSGVLSRYLSSDTEEGGGAGGG
ncbi:hypothetical protein [Roseovarius amoyensis]|uniref:hypothetical protein n=1 Tax=Roseovarius amoyensis TaxID=2211448 RepID=UPI000DBE88B7|nr:hypothetical protein [Roseovarius amoyensis]